MNGVSRHDAVELISMRHSDAGVLLSCEHASEDLPPGWVWPDADRRLHGSHWTYDLGAAALTRSLAAALGAAAVLARFSRMLIDPNRPLSSDTLFRQQADGAPVILNQCINAVERAARVAYWQHYHDALAEQAAGRAGQVLLSVHSFTAVYEGAPREVEIGVLFDREEALARRLVQRLAPLEAEVRLNEPYSGREGLIYSAQHHADSAAMRALEIEVRQDRLADSAFVDSLVACLVAAAADW